ncbi:MAG: DegT/DnrJ/EryC1/StrS family aminotransferase [Nitrospinaceae bacterium]|nr:DegT/DnrJ/EryC1/StrS family aminotransferase [Nitrospinaceae bacterium]
MIPITKPDMDESEARAASESILSGWITQGPRVAEFEAAFAGVVGADHACAVSNCTAAMHLTLLAAGVGPGDEVITASHSFIATANSVRYCGAEPIFVDIDSGTFNMDPAKVQEAITDRTRAILCVHQMGMPCELDAILGVARERGIAVIEDDACAAGSEVLVDGSWESVGRPHGDVACFSFHPRKVISTGEGGMLTTKNPEMDRNFRIARHQGMSVSDTERHGASQVIFESYPTIGYNYRMTDIQAAIGLKQVERLAGLVARRRALAERYGEILSGISGLALPFEPEWARSNWQSYCVRLPEGCDQRKVMQHMLDHGVSTRRGIMCSHLEAPYAGATLRHLLPESVRAQAQCVLIPLFPQMSELEQNQVAEALSDGCAV